MQSENFRLVAERHLFDRTRRAQQRNPVEQHAKCDARFNACEIQSQALMDSVAEGELSLHVARNIECIGVIEHIGVTISGPDQRNDRLTC